MAAMWQCLERVRGLGAVAEEWRRGLGDDFDVFREAFLLETTRSARSHPCLNGCGCSHEVPPGSRVAVCQCDPADCEDFEVAEADLLIWDLNCSSLGQALGRALGSTRRVEPAGVGGVWDVGELRGSSVRVLLSIQGTADEFRGAVAEISGQRMGPFLLIAPTGTFLSVASRQLLAGAGAKFLDLETHFGLNANGTLSANKQALDLVSALVPKEEEDLSDEALRKAYAQILLAAKAEPGGVEGPIKDVFDLYCMKDFSAREVAVKLKCSKATIINRLAEIRRLSGGLSPASLRDHKPFFERMDKDLTDPRARRLRRKDAASGDDPSGENDPG